MRRKDNVFVRDIANDELKKLNKIKNSRNSELRERALIILHSHHGKTVPEIQKELLRARNTVLHWIRRFNHNGLSGLENRKPPGAKEKFTNPVRQEISRIAATDPQDLGLDFKAWSLSKLREYLIEEEIIESISIESVRICLLKENVALKRPVKKVKAVRRPGQEARVARAS
jgi:transposase